MKIDCSDFKKYLDAYFDEELADAERSEFDAHVAVCSDCRQHYEHRVWFQGAVRPAMRRPCRLSTDARQRMRESLRGEAKLIRRRRTFRRVAKVVPAMAAASAIFLLVTPLTGFVPAPVVDEAVSQHMDRTPVDVPTPEVDEVERWFSGRLSFRFQAPRFRNAQATLLGGRMTRVVLQQNDRRSAAHLVYGIGRHKLSVLAFPAHGLDVNELHQGKPESGHAMDVHDAQGYRVLLYRKGDVAYAVTSDLPEKEMLSLLAQ
jgi:anti-sigma factor RsiW